VGQLLKEDRRIEGLPTSVANPHINVQLVETTVANSDNAPISATSGSRSLAVDAYQGLDGIIDESVLRIWVNFLEGAVLFDATS
jgi:hypothetical protein